MTNAQDASHSWLITHVAEVRHSLAVVQPAGSAASHVNRQAYTQSQAG